MRALRNNLGARQCRSFPAGAKAMTRMSTGTACEREWRAACERPASGSRTTRQWAANGPRVGREWASSGPSSGLANGSRMARELLASFRHPSRIGASSMCGSLSNYLQPHAQPHRALSLLLPRPTCVALQEHPTSPAATRNRVADLALPLVRKKWTITNK